MFFTIDKQKIEIDSYCRKFPPAPRSAVRCPALAAKVKPSPAVSYFFVQFLLQMFPCSRRAALGIPRCSVRFPPVFLRKTTPFSGHLPSGRPKTAGKISPGVSSVHLSFSSHGRLRRRVQPYGFTRFAFHHFQQNRSRFFSELCGVFQDFHGTARNPSPAPLLHIV